MEARTAPELPFLPAEAPTSDQQRFEAIYREHFGAIRAYARRRLSTRADDVVSETFLVAWRRRDQVPDDALPWLYGVARRVVADTLRGDRREDAVSRRCQLAESRATEAAANEDTEVIGALRRLSEPDRELLLLVYWEDLEPRRAARALGCSRATVATRLWRAHQRLRREIDRTRGARDER